LNTISVIFSQNTTMKRTIIAGRINLIINEDYQTSNQVSR
jgi:hypothetical protein